MVLSAIGRWPQSFHSSVFLGLNILDYYRNDGNSKEGKRYSISLAQLAQMKPDLDFSREKISMIHRQFDIGYVPGDLQINNIMLHTVNYCVEAIRGAIKNTSNPDIAKRIPDEIYTAPEIERYGMNALFVKTNTSLADTIHNYLLSEPDGLQRVKESFQATLDLIMQMEDGTDGHRMLVLSRKDY